MVIGLLVAACGEKEGEGPFLKHEPASNTKPGDGGVLEQDVGKPDPRAPVVEIVDPLPAQDPNANTLITSADVVVRCRVTASKERRARDVDQGSVAMQALWVDSEGTEQSVAATVSSISQTEFEGRLSLATVPNGAVRFKCSAKDLFQSGVPLQGWANVDTFLDLGPQIKIFDPKEGKIHCTDEPAGHLVQGDAFASKWCGHRGLR